MTNSVILGFFIKLYKALMNSFDHSSVMAALHKIGYYSKNSVILGFFIRLLTVKQRHYTEKSLLLNLSEAILRFLSKIAAAIYRFFAKVAETSLLAGAIRGILAPLTDLGDFLKSFGWLIIGFSVAYFGLSILVSGFTLKLLIISLGGLFLSAIILFSDKSTLAETIRGCVFFRLTKWFFTNNKNR